jgi:protein-tyrosine phosphatase
MENKTPINMLFVCMGNICRSPTAEGVMQKVFDDKGLTEKVQLDSAGTHAYHVDEPPDPRAIAAARERAVDISHLKARKVSTEDFYRFDHIIAMDADNLAVLDAMRPADSSAELCLMLRYSRQDPDGCVPDPYYGSVAGFERVLDLLEEAGEQLAERLLVV